MATRRRKSCKYGKLKNLLELREVVRGGVRKLREKVREKVGEIKKENIEYLVKIW